MPALVFPETRQSTGFSCGAAATQSVLYYYGMSHREDDIIQHLPSDPDKGTPPANIVRYLTDSGLSVQAGTMTLQDVKNWIDQGVPVMAVIQAWTEDPNENWATSIDDGHWVVVMGYDDEMGVVILDDPSLLDNRGFIPYDEFEIRWHDADSTRLYLHYGVAAYGKKPLFDPGKMIKVESMRQALDRSQYHKRYDSFRRDVYGDAAWLLGHSGFGTPWEPKAEGQLKSLLSKTDSEVKKKEIEETLLNLQEYMRMKKEQDQREEADRERDKRKKEQGPAKKKWQFWKKGGRPLNEIARDIRRDWKKVYFGAVPYLQAMGELDSIDDMYGWDNARGIVRYFLSNASGWRGPVAKQIKAELLAMVNGGRRASNEMAARVASRYLEAEADGSWSDYPTQDPSAPWTYWGRAQDMYVLDRGIRWFSTAGHGGLGVADGVARRLLSPAAYKMGAKANGYVWYEEDVAYAVPFYEHPEWSRILAQKAGGRAQTKGQLEDIVRRWNPEYFELLGQGGTHPQKPKVGNRIRFEKAITFGRYGTLQEGREGIVVKTTGSSIIFNPVMKDGEVDDYWSLRVPVSYIGNGVTLL